MYIGLKQPSGGGELEGLLPEQLQRRLYIMPHLFKTKQLYLPFSKGNQVYLKVISFFSLAKY